MEFEKTASGLVVPTAPPPPEEEPARKFGLLEIRDPEKRKISLAALSLLWDAMGLSSGGGGIRLPEDGPEGLWDAHYAMWESMGRSLVGDECPYEEVLT